MTHTQVHILRYDRGKWTGTVESWDEEQGQKRTGTGENCDRAELGWRRTGTGDWAEENWNRKEMGYGRTGTGENWHRTEMKQERTGAGENSDGGELVRGQLEFSLNTVTFCVITLLRFS